MTAMSVVQEVEGIGCRDSPPGMLN